MAGLPIHDGLLQIFDVEHGCCALLTVPSGEGGFRRLMIDCGHNSTLNLYPGRHLRGLGVTYLEQLAVTNFDEDHVSGYPDLLNQDIHVASILRNPSVSPETIKYLKSEDGMGAGIDALVSNLGTYVPSNAPVGGPPLFPGVQREWFWNKYPHFEDENNLSLVLHLRIHGFSFMFPGDMECAGFENMLRTNERFREVVGGLDVLMASHHGRENGLCEDMFDMYGCAPKLVVISDDYKQYSTQETTRYYASKTSGIANFRTPGCRRDVLTTRNDGEIVFTFERSRCWVN